MKALLFINSKNGTTFDNVADLYKFDRELRILVFSAIEKIEVAVRGQLVYNYSMDLKDPFWLNNSASKDSPAVDIKLEGFHQGVKTHQKIHFVRLED